MSEEKPLESIKPGPVSNIINVPPTLVRQNYSSIVTSQIEVRDERNINARLEAIVRSYIQPLGNALSISAPPTSVAKFYTLLVNSMLDIYIKRVTEKLDMLENMLDAILSGREYKLPDGTPITLENVDDIAAAIGKEIEMETIALSLATMRVAALVSMNLPPQYRPALLNMSIVGIDVVQTPKDETLKQVMEKLEQLASLASTVPEAGENVARRRISRRRRRR